LVKQALQNEKKGGFSGILPWVLLRLKGGALCLLQTSYRPDELDVLAEAAPADFGMLK
jgi:hypothetical protein